MMIAINEIKGTNDQILNQMESSNKEFAEIVKIISEIGEKTKVIDDIVFQTKLLSFNASVEAARAGEHGKGFAVVAEEVGNLAQMSGNAAKQITDLLSGSIKKVNDIVNQTSARVDQLVEVGKDKISMGLSTATKCRDALNIISENANTVTAMVTEIAHASKEQSQGVQEINKAISQLDQVTQQNAAVAQGSSSQAEHLKAESISLSSAVMTLTELMGTEKSTSTHLVNDEQSKTFKKAVVSNQSHGPVKSHPMNQSATKKATVKNGPVNASSKKITLEQRNEMAKVTKKAASSTELDVPSSNDKNFESF
jgi:methyl-accepting chemotaxis protein